MLIGMIGVIHEKKEERNTSAVTSAAMGLAGGGFQKIFSKVTSRFKKLAL